MFPQDQDCQIINSRQIRPSAQSLWSVKWCLLLDWLIQLICVGHCIRVYRGVTYLVVKAESLLILSCTELCSRRSSLETIVAFESAGHVSVPS